VLWSLVVVFCMLGALIAVFGRGGGDHATGGSATPGRTARVVPLAAAVDSSLAKTTVAVNFTESVSLFGFDVTATGAGALDLGKKAMTLNLKSSVLGKAMTEQVTAVNGTIYLKSPLLGSLLGGKQWVSMTAPVGTSSSTAGSTFQDLTDPAALLKMLAAQGATVRDLGPSTVDGTAVQGYADTFTGRTLAQKAAGSTSKWATALEELARTGNITFTVYVDGTGLLRRLVIAAKDTVTLSKTMTAVKSAAGTGSGGAAPGSPGGTSTPSSGSIPGLAGGKLAVAVNETMTFSKWGTPVTITAPTPNQVATFQQIAHSMGSSAGASGAAGAAPAF
jgi:hypothetical protein